MAASRVPTLTEETAGLLYLPDFVSEAEEEALVPVLYALVFSEVRMRGQVARRTVAHFGLRYDYEGWGLVPAEPLPSSLHWLADRAGTVAGVDPAEFAEVLVTRYPPGAGIGWHRDAPMFGAKVVGVSLGSACRMRFQRKVGDARRTFDLELEPRSAYVLAGPARSAWQHSIPATKALRYSITFRTLRNPDRWRG